MASKQIFLWPFLFSFNICVIYYFIICGEKEKKMPCSVQVPLPKGTHALSASICCQVLGYMFSESDSRGCESGVRGKEKYRQQSVLLREGKTCEVSCSLPGQRRELRRGCRHRWRRWEPFSASSDWASPACVLKFKVPLSQRYCRDWNFFQVYANQIIQFDWVFHRMLKSEGYLLSS